jgi:hypothetical protein
MSRGPVSRKLSAEKVVLDLAVMHRIGIPAALMLRTLSFWSEKAEDGWAYRTQDELRQATTLSIHQQQQARGKLEELGLLREQRRGVPARIYYRIDFDALDQWLSDPTDWTPKIDTPVYENSQTGVEEFADRSGNPDRLVGENSPTIKEGLEVGISVGSKRDSSSTVSDPATMFLDPESPVAADTDARPGERPSSQNGSAAAAPLTAEPLMFTPQDVEPLKLDKASRRQIESRAHGLISGYYKAMSMKAPRMEPLKSINRQHFDALALEGGYTAADVEGCTAWMLSEPYWDGKMLPPSQVALKLQWWVLNGRPSDAKPVSPSLTQKNIDQRARVKEMLAERMGLSPQSSPPDNGTIEAEYKVV